MRRNHTGTPPNDSYWISIYNDDIYLYTISDGIDSTGYIFIYWGNINVFSKEKGTDAPIDHNGNFNLFNEENLGIGTGGVQFVHEGINKENQMFGFYTGKIGKDNKIEIQDENNQIIKSEIMIKFFFPQK